MSADGEALNVVRTGRVDISQHERTSTGARVTRSISNQGANMTVSITFRHIDATEALKGHATTRISRLQKFLQKPMEAKVTLSHEKLESVVEVQVHSGGEWYEAKEVSADMYAAIDTVVAKLERQITKRHGVSSARRHKEVDLRHMEEGPALESSLAEASGDR
jgi:putative sigma-54 modulation protein